ncbi:hypothetical protein EVAR_33877_1 [Eumeta japonica]|uniref:Mos1 transposase HTH domain-containing protein n=1 Tax=Eumeta variegata TaxID=151549 RepID=A0A4C1WI59_EUMVA|nr:hypothetical protein EVAR_33877_1 [Eumeta japonica]
MLGIETGACVSAAFDGEELNIIKKGKNATQAAKNICDAYRPNAASAKVAENWFKRFQSESFLIQEKDQPPLPGAAGPLAQIARAQFPISFAQSALKSINAIMLSLDTRAR